MRLLRLWKVLAVMLIAAVVLMATARPARAETSPFTDLPADHWAYASVRGLVEKGLLSGYPDGSFRGSNLVTRYALAVTLAKAIQDGVLTAGPAAGGSRGPSALGAGDLDTFERLIKEFSEELALVGIKTAALEEQLQAQRQDIDVLTQRVDKLEEGRQRGDDNGVRFSNGRIRGLAYNKSNINGSIDAILEVEAGVNEDVEAHLGLRYTNIADQLINETFGTYEAYLRSKRPVGPVDELKLGRFNSFLGSGMVLYDRREGIEAKASSNDINFEVSYFDALLSHVWTELASGGKLGFYYLRQDRVAGRRPEYLGVYAEGGLGEKFDYSMEFSEYDNDGATLTNRDDKTGSFQVSAGVKVAKDFKLRLGYWIQGEDFRALAVDSDLRWQFPDGQVSPHHDVLQALRDATPAGVDPDAVPGFRDLRIGADFKVPNTPWSGRFDLDLLRGHTSVLDHSDDDFDVVTLAVERPMGDGLDFQLRYQAVNFDNESGTATVDALPTLVRRDTQNVRAQVVKRF